LSDSADAVWNDAWRKIEALGGPDRLREPQAAYALTRHAGWIEAISGEREPISDFVAADGVDNVFATGFLSAQPLPSRLRFEGNRNIVFFGPRSRLAGMDIVITGDDNLVYFGALSSSGTFHVPLRGDGQSILIGDHCMFSHGTVFGQMDPVALYSTVNGAPLDTDRNILVGDHVWIGRDVTLKAGTVVEPDTVIGQSARLDGVYPGAVILAGAPARVLKTDVTWGRSAEPTLQALQSSKHYHAHVLRQVNIIKARIAALATTTLPEPR
jgi:carbonic anhydrase/acetyltransferase-like protein (isoleucine patch superfamily)